MVNLLSSQDTTTLKLHNQKNPIVLVTDFDGTLFSPNHHILEAPFNNRKIAVYLKQHSIPFIIATGRSDWTDWDKRHVTLLGLPKPDAVITANGTVIYHHSTNKTYIRDFDWEAIMQYSKVTWKEGKKESWNKLAISTDIKEYLDAQKYRYTLSTGNTFLIRITFLNISPNKLEQIKKEILALFPQGLRIIFTEKLLRKNTLDVFSGDMLVTPKLGGKDNATKYLFEKYAKETQSSPIHGLIFGDAVVDIPMLTLKENSKYYTLSQYLVNPTALAKNAAEIAQKTNSHLYISMGDGPKKILEVLSNIYSSKKEVDFDLKYLKQTSTNNNVVDIAKSQNQEKISKASVKDKNELTGKSSFSPAQNNPIRQVLKKIEPFLDTFVDKKLSANEISFLGIAKLSGGLEKLYNPKSNIFEKITGLYNYGFGNLTDVLDGIRARSIRHSEHNKNSHADISASIPGQLVDGFSDRAKEFIQLFTRAKKRINNASSSLNYLGKNQTEVFLKSLFFKNHSKQNIPENQSNKPFQQYKNKIIEQSVSNFLTAISCTLPSIARAQVEISNKSVPEKDEKGGSMIDRTKKLFYSLFLDTIGAQQKSQDIDKKIFDTNIATFKNRLGYIPSEAERSLAYHPELVGEFISDFQKNALERWLLYVDVLQQEDEIIKKYLSKNPSLLIEYEKQSQKIAKEYLTIPVNKFRKKWRINNYKLEIKRFI